MPRAVSRISFFSALAAFIGTVFGAGFLGLPYALQQSGLGIFLAFALLALPLVLLVNFLFADVVLRSKPRERMLGYVKEYLGVRMERIFLVINIIGFWGSLLAYLIIWGDFASTVFSSWGIAPQWFSLAFFVLSLALIFRKARTIEKVEIIMLIFVGFLLVALLVLGLPEMTHVPTQPDASLGWIFPFGTLLFAWWGAGIIPELVNQLRGNITSIKRLISLGTALPVAASVVFAVFVASISGDHTTQEAISGLAPFLGRTAVVIGSCIGLVTVGLAYNNITWISRNTLTHDLGMRRLTAIALTVIPPIILIIGGVQNVVIVMSVSGAIFLALQGTVIFLVYIKSRAIKKGKGVFRRPLPTWILVAAITLFLVGALVELVLLVQKLILE